MCSGSRLVIVLSTLLTVGVATDPFVQTTFAQEEPTEGKKKKKNEGRRKGVRIGAITGLALGALTGEADLAVKGAAAGAVAGGASGAWYDYDQSRQDDRTQMLADAVGGSKSEPAATGETVGDVGRLHMQDFVGDWKLEMWGLDENGDRITGKGLVKGISAGENATRILYRDIQVEGIDEGLGGGYSLMSYDPGQGFFLENSFSFSDETLKFTGEYLADKNVYNYYLMTHTDSEMISGGIMRSSVRIEIRVATPSLWFADTYTHLGGKEVQVQSYRFFKP